VIYSIVNETLRQAHLTLDDLDAIAITRGPGLLARWCRSKYGKRIIACQWIAADWD